ncbi:YncE family protein [Algoriphagus hitonicola]|uniref:40-residue YVTN family beta-propeller repeat-containing protein n=1 Tax=Algoriphagus hitonicola TaxID=435880 RepID=A0A1I2X0T5_9BACT|nr:DUF5074 domain-containing protein [Algoriphagus hitonicola]SFH06637.1 hypothetical protein SAMN04487988_11536 [Algoriphagus hitonicola]
MKKHLFHFSKVIALAFILFSCTNSETEKPLGEFDSGILIMNEGAFGSNDGEVYHLNPATDELKPNIFESANGRPFAGLLQDLVLENDQLYLVANTGKIEIVNSGDFASIGAVTADLDQPRSLTVNSGKLFISDYGPYDADFNTPDSYIAVVQDVNGGGVTNKIPVSRKPEDLISFGKFILVAGSEEGIVEVIDAEEEEVIETIEVEGSPKVFFEANGGIYLFSTSLEEVTIYSFNLDDFTTASTDVFPISNATGKIAFGNDGIMYLIRSSGFPDYVDAVATLSLFNSTVNPTWYEGSGFYGIGADPLRGEIYLANANGFQGNGTVTVLDESGNEVRDFEVGRGPSGFLMR